VLHLVELSRLTGVEGYVAMEQLSIVYPVALALTSTIIGLMLYRLRYLTKVTS
jgi:hypothetical protein